MNMALILSRGVGAANVDLRTLKHFGVTAETVGMDFSTCATCGALLQGRSRCVICGGSEAVAPRPYDAPPEPEPWRQLDWQRRGPTGKPSLASAPAPASVGPVYAPPTGAPIYASATKRRSGGIAGWFGRALKRRVIVTGAVLAISWAGTQAGLIDSADGRGPALATESVDIVVDGTPAGWAPSRVDGIGWSVPLPANATREDLVDDFGRESFSVTGTHGDALYGYTVTYDTEIGSGPNPWLGLSQAELDQFSQTYATNSGPGISVTSTHAATVATPDGAVTGIWIESTNGFDQVWELVLPLPGAYFSTSVYADDPLIPLAITPDHFFGMVTAA